MMAREEKGVIGDEEASPRLPRDAFFWAAAGTNAIPLAWDK
jgi:hypothetical protein